MTQATEPHSGSLNHRCPSVTPILARPSAPIEAAGLSSNFRTLGGWPSWTAGSVVSVLLSRPCAGQCGNLRDCKRARHHLSEQMDKQTWHR